MYYYKAAIQYEGTNYAGFQWQKEIQTVQGAFNGAISKLIGGKFSTTAASRTDTGVHAMEQIVKICSIDRLVDVSSFLIDLNNVLPRDIRCIDLKPCEWRFRPSAEAVSKEYRYFFTNGRPASKEEQQFIANISNALDLEAMMTCVRALVGVHDFCNFYSSGSNVKSTVRNIFLCELAMIDPHDIFPKAGLFQTPNHICSCYQLRIEGNGFLKQMIRHIVSALWMVGSGKLSSDDFMALLNAPKKQKQLWKVASPNGLFLYRITYR